ncbi:hypothetical protein PENTCL1PPCAC_24069, partial [Pristionchus entomophagus]
FFGKPGYSWHFAHVYAVVNGELVQHVYIHIFKNDVQNGSLVIEVMKHIAEDLAKMGIRIMHLRSDAVRLLPLCSRHCHRQQDRSPIQDRDRNVELQRGSGRQ